MIPNFPEFKKIELSDKDQVEQITGAFLPYSDFDFISMVSWDVSGEMGFSLLNGNLVVRFTDYISRNPFFSFIGRNMANETVAELVTFSKQQNIEPVLKFIPEEVAVLIDPQLFSVIEDRNSFDYIYSTEAHRSFSGGEFSGKRNEISAIRKSHPEIETTEIDVYDSSNHTTMIALYQKWGENKLANKKDFEAREEAAFNRLLDCLRKNTGDLKGIGVYHAKELLAFCIYEIANSEYAVGHTAKCDVSIKGTNAILMKNLADRLFETGIKYFNYEQDLGLENLRISKMRYRPSFFLKKYIITAR
jgi:hypothetical protein